MLKFSQFPYVRPDMEDLTARMKAHTGRLANAKSVGEAYRELIETDYLEKQFVTYATFSEAGATNNSYDPFYAEEEAFFGAAKPNMQLLMRDRNRALCLSPFAEKIKELTGNEMFDAAEMKMRTVSDEVLPLMEEEDGYSRAYSRLMSQLAAEEDGRRLPLAMIGKLGDSPDEDVRRRYALLAEKTLLTAADELDTLYDNMVRVRTAIARATGFDTYTDYCLFKHGRTGYGREELKRFHEAVKRDIVPLAARLHRQTEERLGHPVPYHDENRLFPGMDSRVKRDPKEGFAEIFSLLSPETKVFFDELTEREFFDLALRDGKTNGAYSNFVPLCGMPYIFETYNDTFGAVRTFAHECGHGLHAFLHRGEEVLAAAGCSSDLAETHSLGMEFFVWRHIEKMIPENAVPLYKYAHLKSAVAFLPYGTAIDRFQTEVYDHPDWTPKKRLDCWKEMECAFTPWRRHEKGLFYDAGRMWQRQIHVMKWPFYYIDYVLAQVCALQFFLMEKTRPDEAWKAYIRLLKESGLYSFSETVRRAGLRTPFEEGLLRDIGAAAEESLAALIAR